MECLRRANPFHACAGLRILGYLMLVLVGAIVAVSYYAVVVCAWGPLLLADSGGSAAGAAIVLAAFHLLLAMILWCYLMAVFTDPGAVPENWRHSPEEGGVDADNTSAISNTVTTDSENPPFFTSEEQRSAPGYCSRCQNGKPPRCHHCSVCELVLTCTSGGLKEVRPSKSFPIRCVLKMDHHCVWIVNCVGARNYKYFLLFLVYTFLETVLDTLVLLPRFILFFRDESRRSSSASDIAILFLAFVLNLAFALSLLCFIAIHTSLVKRNTTSIEVYERRKSVSWEYDLGWRKNLEQVFGTKKLLWFFPLYSIEDLHNIPALRGFEFPTRSDAVV